ncbi:MAG: hypothetical protein V4713_10205 [Pseudomonadota bacterium]
MAIENEFYPPDKAAPNQRESSPLPEPQASPTKRNAFDLGNLSTTLTVALTLAGAGFAFGTHWAEAKAHEAMASLQADNIVKSAELARSKVELTTWSDAYLALQKHLVQKEEQIAALTVATGNIHNCDYLRQQIESTKLDIQNEQFPASVQMDREKFDQQQKFNIARLDGHLSQLIDKFGTCTKGGA